MLSKMFFEQFGEAGQVFAGSLATRPPMPCSPARGTERWRHSQTASTAISDCSSKSRSGVGGGGGVFIGNGSEQRVDIALLSVAHRIEVGPRQYRLLIPQVRLQAGQQWGRQGDDVAVDIRGKARAVDRQRMNHLNRGTLDVCLLTHNVNQSSRWPRHPRTSRAG